MKHYKTEYREHTVLDKTVCDMCGAETTDYYSWPHCHHSVNKTIIRYEWGFHYPEGNAISMFDIDLCPRCFEGELIPWLESRGVKVREEEQE